MKEKASKPVKLPHGRPSTYTEAKGLEICERLGKGEPLAQICRDEGMPAVRTVSLWREMHPEFSASFARAREDGWDFIASDCLTIADEASGDYSQRIGEDGGVSGEKFNAEHVQRSKLRIETRLKLLAKWDPKRYGEKLAIGGAEDMPAIRAEGTVTIDPGKLSSAVLQELMDARANPY